ncbi:5'-deoxynucleotidase HDDC2 [Octopus bimaculoides]|uniref:5'-deoxynucleotidase HDDC2 n=1 Tax=Octopus bimaculoides TaxID=37653 RepID=A0A0L8I1C4_OCTBM|nr:5'-deoxynucleotidase HDDC2 [Octopus bimaculoides]|eukprot:XP_014767681.1 PREDICTED: HD domain-containing protein 2-like [Octopus bimaculoides]
MTEISGFSKLFEFMTLVGQLKRIRRTGWIRKNVSDPESVSDHMYRMAVLAFLTDPSLGLDRERCIKLSLVHDLAESIVGDLAPSDNVSKPEKRRREETAMNLIKDMVGGAVGQEFFQLWQEYENVSSKEAEYVKDLDKFEMVLQAYEYEQLDRKPKSLQDFFDSTKGHFTTKQVQKWMSELEKIRENS